MSKNTTVNNNVIIFSMKYEQIHIIYLQINKSRDTIP